MAKKPMRPGTHVPISGIYKEVGPREGKPRRVTCIRDEPLPPSSEAGQEYILDKATKRKPVEEE